MHTLNGQIFGVAMCASGVSNKDSGVVAIRAVERAYESIRLESIRATYYETRLDLVCSDTSLVLNAY